jgi:Flp pilus assembly protein TadD
MNPSPHFRMKTIFKLFIAQLCCFSLLVTDTLAKGNDRKGGGGASSRPNVRKSSGGTRNPITGSKTSRPASRPAAKPASRPANVTRPQAKPAERPKPQQRPQAKPAERPNRPETRPAERPNRPETRPGERPNRPEIKPGERPENRPGNRPENRPNRPETKPGERPNRPEKPNQRPETKPGHVTYPKPNRPGGNNNANNRPGGNNRPDQKPNVRPGQNTKPIKRPNFDNDKVGNHSGNNSGNHSNNKNWWSSGNNSNNRVNVVNNKNVYRGDKNVQINNNFKQNVNWSTNQKNWGYNPWWNRPATRPWYGGSWNCGWSNNYYHSHHYYHGHYWGGYRPLPGYVVYDDDDNDVAKAIGWGLVGWGLGKLIFDSGYQTYQNPYPAQPVQSSKGTEVTYTQPITVVAAQTAPAAAEEVSKVTEVSESYVTASQDAFKQRNYLVAIESANKAVGEAPGDGALHEYRALVLFALGKYSEAAGVLNPVLAGGPGWDWSTMISLYDAQQTYTAQLEALEAYSKSKPDAADARFLLGYHYMVCGHLEQAAAEFAEAAKLQPKDTVSAQLRDLTAASSNSGDSEAADPADAPANTPPPPAPVPLEKLTGTWVSSRGDQGTVTLAFKDDGKFLWTFKNDKATNEFGGDYSMNDNGLLVLDAEESQMVASVSLPQDSQLKFVLAGGPPGDPGMDFTKQ